MSDSQSKPSSDLPHLEKSFQQSFSIAFHPSPPKQRPSLTHHPLALNTKMDGYNILTSLLCKFLGSLWSSLDHRSLLPWSSKKCFSHCTAVDISRSQMQKLKKEISKYHNISGLLRGGDFKIRISSFMNGYSSLGYCLRWGCIVFWKEDISCSPSMSCIQKPRYFMVRFVNIHCHSFCRDEISWCDKVMLPASFKLRYSKIICSESTELIYRRNCSFSSSGVNSSPDCY